MASIEQINAFGRKLPQNPVILQSNKSWFRHFFHLFLGLKRRDRQINHSAKDLTTFDGLTGTLEFETLDDQGLIKSSWMEYIAKAFPKINDRHAKNIVLHLSKHRDREWTREELREALNLEMPDSDLEKKLTALVKADIINKGTSYYCYRGVNDTIFDKVFRGVYDENFRGQASFISPPTFFC